jgi:hypothetical protein
MKSSFALTLLLSTPALGAISHSLQQNLDNANMNYQFMA